MRTAFPPITKDNMPAELLSVQQQLFLLQAFANMREAQRRFFKARTASGAQKDAALTAAKAAEAVADQLLSTALDKITPRPADVQELF